MPSFATNIAWTTSGKPDIRPGMWGTTDVVNSEIPFINVPQGQRVKITGISGNQIAAPYGTMDPNGMAYVLVGLTNTTPNQSPYVGPGLGSEGCCLYKQACVPQHGMRCAIDEESVDLLLNADNILIIKQALFLSTAGVPIHMEVSAVIAFEYVPAPAAIDESGAAR